jgi:hypothetical protein
MILSPPPTVTVGRIQSLTNSELVDLIIESRRVVQIMRNNPDSNIEIKEKWEEYNECLQYYYGLDSDERESLALE